MKINWGWGITIFYTFFIIAMVSMVIKSFSFNSELVVNDYYQKDLDYEEFRQRRQNAELIKDEVKVVFDKPESKITIQLPPWMEQLSGEAYLYRPSSENLDRRYELQFNEDNHAVLPIGADLEKGLYDLQVEWKDATKSYYYETTLVL